MFLWIRPNEVSFKTSGWDVAVDDGSETFKLIENCSKRAIDWAYSVPCIPGINVVFGSIYIKEINLDTNIWFKWNIIYMTGKKKVRKQHGEGFLSDAWEGAKKLYSKA